MSEGRADDKLHAVSAKLNAGLNLRNDEIIM